MYQISCLLLGFLPMLIVTMIHQTTTASAQFPHFCSNDTMFTNGSTYQSNLNTLFHALASNATNNPSGFYRTTVGNPSIEAVYGEYLCTGDQNISSCHQCVATATTTDIPRLCPNMKVAILWYDECQVRYSNSSFFNNMDESPAWIAWHASDIIGGEIQYMDAVTNMISNVIAVRAAEGGLFKKFATDFVNYSAIQPIYGLGQCTPNLNANDCYQCLNSSIQRIHQNPGGRVLAPSCIVRFEAYPFFNLSFLPQVPPPSPSPLPSGPSPSLASDSKPIPVPSDSNGKRNKRWIIAIVVVAFLLIAAAMFGLSRKTMRKNFKHEGNGHFKLVDSLELNFSTIQFATHNFSDDKRLGSNRSSATPMYKGVHPDGQEIAVKKINKGGKESRKEVDNEVLLSATFQHKNLVKFLGSCVGKDIRILVYEFLPNGSLHDYLCDPVKRARLDWPTRYHIISGLARGLLYLHEDSQVRVIHRDLKPNNILLDAQMDPKISNYSTASLVRADQTKADSRVAGTYGYMPIEYVQHGHSSMKSDIFSFGVILLEIISGYIISRFSDGENEENLLTYAWRKWNDGSVLDVVDQTLSNIERHINQIQRCIKIALLCVEEDPRHRPSMSTVVFMLNSDTVDITEPIRPAPLILSDKGLHSDSHSPQETSLNEASISTLDPR